MTVIGGPWHNFIILIILIKLESYLRTNTSKTSQFFSLKREVMPFEAHGYTQALFKYKLMNTLYNVLNVYLNFIYDCCP